MAKEVSNLAKLGDSVFQKGPKCSAELLALTYGVFVQKLLRESNDFDAAEVNAQLDLMGYNMGCRMVD